jgi:Spy/CpxP family protein refolding chaperone
VKTKLMMAMVVMAVMAAAFAQSPGGPGMLGGPGMPEGMAAFGLPAAPTFDAVQAYLGLTDTQIASLLAVRKAAADSVKTLVDQIRTKEQALRSALDQGVTDANAVGKAVLEIESLRKQVQSTMKAAYTEAVNLLTTDQRTKLAKLEEAAKLRDEIRQAGALGLWEPSGASTALAWKLHARGQ